MGTESLSRALVEFFPHLLPEGILVAIACVVFLGATTRAGRNLWYLLSLGALATGVLLIIAQGPPLSGSNSNRPETFASPVLFDNLTWFIRLLAFGGGLVFVLFSWSEVPEKQAADFLGCMLVTIAGLSMCGSANDLIGLFLSLEMISIPTYVLLYLPRYDEASQEASMKYFLLSIFSSAFLLFGFSYLYGLAGTTNLSGILHALDTTDVRDRPALASVVLIMVVAGLGFKITAAPFHFYAPDVYQGAPTVGAALLAFIPKAAGFVALLRVLGFVFPAAVSARAGIGMAFGDQTPILLCFLAAVTMFVGNLLALWQDNLKRLFAYSSIAHAGYMLIALAAAPLLRQAGRNEGADGIEALLYYLVAYGAMTVGAFAVISYLSTPERPIETVDDLAGLSRSHPGVALLMVLFLFSLIGIPLTAGFTGKFLIFFGALAVPGGERATLFPILAVLGMINAAIGAWYYLRLVAVMYLRTSVRPVEGKWCPAGLAAVGICALLTLGLSLPPGADWLVQAARKASGATTAAAPK